MAIVVPAAGDEISASSFGIPVANAVNLLSTPRIIAGAYAFVNQAVTIAQATWFNLPGVTVTFTAKANWSYLIGWQAYVTPDRTATWLIAGLSVDGAAPSRFASALAPSPVLGYKTTLAGSQPTSARLGGVLAAGSHTLQLQSFAAVGLHGIDSAFPCFVYVADMGADS